MAIHPLIIVLSLAFGLSAWAAYGLPELLSATHTIAEFCQSIFVRCLGYIEIFKVLFLWSGAATLIAGLAYGSFKGTAGLLRTNKAIKKLPLKKRDGSLILIDDNLSRTAFTHGFLRPKIYISKGLLNGLERDELKAVFLHELYHKKRFDPLRFFLISFLKDSFFYIPVIRHFINNIRIRKEHEADDAAAASFRDKLNLAGALIKVASHNKFAVNSASITGGSPVSARVRRLAEGKEASLPLPGMRAIALSIIVTVFLTLSLSLPLSAANTAAKKECSTNHCSAHMDKLGKSCKTHCGAKPMHTH